MLQTVLQLLSAMIQGKQRLDFSQFFGLLLLNIVAVKKVYVVVKSALQALLIKFIVAFSS
jgi:hypothetical protein